MQIRKAYLGIKILKLRRWIGFYECGKAETEIETEKYLFSGVVCEWVFALTLSYSQGCRVAGTR